MIGLSLTFTNLAEVQTKKRGREEPEEKKKQNTYTKTIHTAGACSRTEGKEKEKTQSTCVLTPEHSWIFLLNQMAEKDLMLILEVLCIRVQPSCSIKASMRISHAIACQRVY